MARALIVGCGCRGRALGASLREQGWPVRGTTRSVARAPAIAAAGVEPALADPARPGTVLDLVADVGVVCWLLGSAVGEPEPIAAVHGPLLEALLARLVDTPVRGFVYEAAGGVRSRDLQRGAELVRGAGERWRIPVAIVDADPADHERWLEAMLNATSRVLASDA
jgi:uncharacterized protein YbjT (DUF2867 family)